MPAGFIVTPLDGRRARARRRAAGAGDRPGAVHGDGVFEENSRWCVVDGPALLLAHLAELAASAPRIAGLPRCAVSRGCSVRPPSPRPPGGRKSEAVLRLVHGRGAGFAAVSSVPDRVAVAPPGQEAGGDDAGPCTG